MAGAYQHRLEMRADKLASAIKSRVDTFSTALTPPGERPPFTQHFSQSRALDMILNNWAHPATQAWIGSMDPASQLELHNALSQHILDKGLMNASSQPEGMGYQMSMDRASMMNVNSLRAPSFQAVRNVS